MEISEKVPLVVKVGNVLQVHDLPPYVGSNNELLSGDAMLYDLVDT